MSNSKVDATFYGANRVEVFERADGRWAWRLKAANGEIVATDGGQGYENRADAEHTAHAVARGEYAPGH